MELTEKTNIPSSLEINVTKLSERNYSKNYRVYDVLFPAKEDEPDPNIENENAIKGQKKSIFGSVSTLDWLKTWRSLEEN